MALARRLRADAGFDQVPIVALTAHAMAEHRALALEAGCDAHWTKPIVDLGAFGGAVAELLQEGRRPLAQA